MLLLFHITHITKSIVLGCDTPRLLIYFSCSWQNQFHVSFQSMNLMHVHFNMSISKLPYTVSCIHEVTIVEPGLHILVSCRHNHSTGKTDFVFSHIYYSMIIILPVLLWSCNCSLLLMV